MGVTSPDGFWTGPVRNGSVDGLYCFSSILLGNKQLWKEPCRKNLYCADMMMAMTIIETKSLN
ncbi:MAG TPA: hypothetical protein DE315_08495 [Candidatus Omnitrophica bacterium]|nr:MAG: hypothetical protein A2Y05_01360 [Omnitrophica WOR_2 bacterium GWA2_53_43]HBO96444.1 hypothetical protein [Candidatus Omnitrophota bacterium]HCI45549.1 hypothetical protein [Candidatus Omnitrophota bacterium]